MLHSAWKYTAVCEHVLLFVEVEYEGEIMTSIMAFLSRSRR